MQSALKDVKGVKEAEVSYDKKEAVIKYDPDVATPEDLIKAVKDAKGMAPFRAKVKK